MFQNLALSFFSVPDSGLVSHQCARIWPRLSEMCQNLAVTVFNVPESGLDYLECDEFVQELPPNSDPVAHEGPPSHCRWQKLPRWQKLTTASSSFAAAVNLCGCGSNNSLQIRQSHPGILVLHQPGSFFAKSCSFPPEIDGLKPTNGRVNVRFPDCEATVEAPCPECASEVI